MEIPFLHAINDIVDHLQDMPPSELANYYERVTNKSLAQPRENALDEIRYALKEWDEDGITKEYQTLLNKQISIS
ncbi:hypothetical protein [Vibrio owensii]|uniref:hypothetical protein n=1 Tax=Vibrio owensii TaxID=696485 RepID=UPI0018F1460A|nr:hypothetical protein [Vibrio owensii]